MVCPIILKPTSRVKVNRHAILATNRSDPNSVWDWSKIYKAVKKTNLFLPWPAALLLATISNHIPTSSHSLKKIPHWFARFYLLHRCLKSLHHIRSLQNANWYYILCRWHHNPCSQFNTITEVIRWFIYKDMHPYPAYSVENWNIKVIIWSLFDFWTRHYSMTEELWAYMLNLKIQEVTRD